MRTKTLFFAFIILGAALFFAACKKDDSPVQNTAVTSVPKIQTEIDYNGQNQVTGITNYEYDSSGKIIKQTEEDGSYTTYIHSSSSVIAKVYTSANILYEKRVYTLNSQGLTSTLSDSSSTGIITYYTYKYDGNGYCVRGGLLFLNIRDTVYIEISGGNIISITDTMRNGTSVTAGKNTYEYFADKTNTIGAQNRGFTMLGKGSRNLVKTEIRTSSGSSSATNYTYETDSLGRVTKRIVFESGNYSSTSYTY